MSAASIARVVGNHLLARRSACHVATKPGVSPRVRSANLRVPDVAISCTPEDPGHDPVLVIEILSPRNEPETWEGV
jgi:Uma2 family endonuclease